MARRAYAERLGSPAQRSARALAALIREEGWTAFSTRDVRRKERSQLRDMEAINPAIRLLESADLIRAIDLPRSSKGGAPKRLYSVNPVMMESAA